MNVPEWSTSLELLKLRDTVNMHLPAIFLRGTRVWSIRILELFKKMLTENKTEHFNIYNKYKINTEENGIVLTKYNEIIKVVYQSTINKYKHLMHCR